MVTSPGKELSKLLYAVRTHSHFIDSYIGPNTYLIKRDKPNFQNPPLGTEEEQTPQHAGKSGPGMEADLERRAGSPGGWCKCECLFLLEEGRQCKEETAESQSENGKQDAVRSNL